jgi:hypothetical protein
LPNSTRRERRFTFSRAYPKHVEVRVDPKDVMQEAVVKLLGQLGGAIEKVAGAVEARCVATAKKEDALREGVEKLVILVESFGPMAAASVGEKLGAKKESAPS